MKAKISIIVLIVLIVSIILPFNYTYATSIGDIFEKADTKFLQADKDLDNPIDEGQLETTSDFLFKVLLAIGIVVMVLVGTILGIKFMIASVEDKAKVKEMLIPYVIGCAVIFGAFTIWSAVINIMQDVF